MNKNDVKLIFIICVIVLLMFLFNYFNNESGSTALVYYEDELILTIDLNIDNEYVVRGKQGDVVLEVKNKKIRVKEENSLKHLCSKEGFIGDSSRVLICLPNKIIVKIIGDDEIDGVVY